ncbi:MAG TPA: hypothetical protein VF175_16745, partial [Lacipirellula sp.]
MSAPLANHPPMFPDPPMAPASTAGREVQPPAPPDHAPIAEGQAWSDRVGTWLADSGIWAWLSSAIVHAAIVIILSLIVLARPTDEPLWVLGGFEDAVTEDEMELDLSKVPLPGENPSLGEFEIGSTISLPGERSATIGGNASPTAGAVNSIASNALARATAPEGLVAAGSLESLSNPLAPRGGGLEGRDLQNRRAAALSGGGTAESEAAVEAALAWFAEHQCPDGSWNFDLEKCPKCAGYCKPSGTHTSRTAATGLALLSFLGAGYTHQDGKYKDVVGNGLYFLREQMTITTFGGDLRDKKAALETELPAGGLLNALQLANARRDSMYSHGIATLAITEAFAMTRDQQWREPATEAIKFIVNAQYNDGGWRYAPKWETAGPGDMTVTGWQVMALKSATLAGIEVPYEVWMKLNDFLEAIQDDG